MVVALTLVFGPVADLGAIYMVIPRCLGLKDMASMTLIDLHFWVHTIGVVLYAASLPATFVYVRFMKADRTAYLKIRFDHLFSIYVFFVVAILARYVWILSQGFRGRDPEGFESTTVGSGL